MTLRVAIQHNTYYEFDRPVSVSPHRIRLRPAPHSRTHIHSYSLKVSPGGHFLNWQQDVFGNFLASVVFPEKIEKLSVEVEVQADMTVINPFDFFLDDDAETFPFDYPSDVSQDLAPYLECLELSPLVSDFLQTVNVDWDNNSSERTIDFLVGVNMLIHRAIEYGIRMEPGVQTPEQTLSLKQGSCRDFAWLFVQVLRHLGLAARFASGYLVQLTADEQSLDGPSGPDADFTDLHAWCEVFLPGAGWVGLDATSGLFAGEGHIPLACTPNPSSAAPIEGATDECEVTFSYENTVNRLHEDPRVTKPYSEAQWLDILALGDKVDTQLLQDDVRLTMGGEPTFVAIDDMDSPQWNTEALGDHKLHLAKSLLLRLRDAFAPQGLLHFGQGKWYPGEEVPRWAMGVYWRDDGEPLWHNPDLLARVDQNYDHDHQSAQRFSEHLAQALGIATDYVHPAYEDALHYLLEHEKLPANMPSEAYLTLDDIEAHMGEAKTHKDRRRLARVLEQGLSTPTGFVLPLEWNSLRNTWQTCRWQFRRERLILAPGDSPLGLRLPLNDLPVSAERHETPQEDPFACKPSLPTTVTGYSSNTQSSAPRVAFQVSTDPSTHAHRAGVHKPTIRTALCVEARDGKLHVFLPPVYGLEAYVRLINAIESTAKALHLPVVIEGYEPPRDHRLKKLLVTPDPGVIEVNIHPSSNWRELVKKTLTLYDCAKQSRLGAEKFMLDGRHTGTGGGNHVTLGGVSPADSPLLRRPDVLRSFITYWQHHPSLSYLFSGAFIGPTSQAPRADEGRDEILYELEIAFDQLPDKATLDAQGAPQPWMVDRVLRNLLIDITGNTHRAEFCIDKLYAPDNASGRLGLLELRGFEMPPHARMSLVQMLLIRTLLARFWRQPYHHRLVRWGTQLHDQFMLPEFVWQDVKEVVEDLRAQGHDFQLDWLAPFEEFRFPHYGQVEFDGIVLELRWAVEPWHVLGEEQGSFGTSRYVDSSVERLQVKMKGLVPDRYVLACNGRRVPLRETGKKGEYVGGVRYRAWSPPSALHPTLGVQVPLVFDVIDTWNGRAIGGCRYHVSHPGGLSYERFPVNAHEAESRRVNRFEPMGHTAGPFATRLDVDAVREFFPERYPPRPMAPPPEEAAGEYPYTLDLRRRAKVMG